MIGFDAGMPALWHRRHSRLRAHLRGSVLVKARVSGAPRPKQGIHFGSGRLLRRAPGGLDGLDDADSQVLHTSAAQRGIVDPEIDQPSLPGHRGRDRVIGGSADVPSGSQPGIQFSGLLTQSA